MVRTGLDRLLADPALAPTGRLGLVTNHSAVSRALQPSVDALRDAGLNIVALYGPEHGVRGDVAAGEHIASGADPRTGLPVHSLYGPNKKPSAQMLEGVDALVFDLQDVGARFYTFLYTLSYCMEAAGEHNLPITVLDRPNPLGGLLVEGNTVKPGFTSFVGLQPIPCRYGLTIGEMARYFRDALGVRCHLNVVPLDGWTRDMLWEDTGLPWAMPSPNIPTPDTARVYPGMCLLEGATLSEGRGATRPFEVFGAPFIDADTLAAALNALELPGAGWRAMHFIPTASKHKDTPCHGCQLHVLDAHAFRPVAVAIHLLATLKRLYPDGFQWRPPYGEGRPPFIDLLAGTDRLRLDLDAGRPAEDIIAEWDAEAEGFAAARREAFLYA